MNRQVVGIFELQQYISTVWGPAGPRQHNDAFTAQVIWSVLVERPFSLMFFAQVRRRRQS